MPFLFVFSFLHILPCPKQSTVTNCIFLKRSKPYKGYSALLFVFRIVTATTSMVAPFILKEIIDAMVKANGIVTPEVVSYMGALVLRWIFVYALDFFGWRMVDLSVITLESRVVRDLYLEAFDYLQRHSFLNSFPIILLVHW